MARITEPILLDKRMDALGAKLDAANVLLSSIAASQSVIAGTQGTTSAEMDYDTIRAQIKLGQAPALFPVGTQFLNIYTDKDGENHPCPWDVVKADDTAEGQSGTTAPALIMQMHYATLYDVPFSEHQAFYIVPEGGMVAGTYHVTFGFDLILVYKDHVQPSSVKNGESWQFTISKALPAGTLLCGFYSAPHVDITTLKVYTYKDQYKSELLDTCTISKGNGGTSLGTFMEKESGSLNSLYSVVGGDNRWWKSACRQYLNSDAAAGAWWNPQDKWDMMPDCAKTLPGFLAGFSEDFKNALTPVKVVTYDNLATGDGSAVITYDKIFLPSLEELYLQPLVKGEGSYWPYWKERTGATAPQALLDTYPSRITRDLAQPTVARYVRTRSAGLNDAASVLCVDYKGFVSNWGAADVTRLSPSCKLTRLG